MLALCACGNARVPKYSVVFTNGTQSVFSEVKLQAEAFRLSAGWLGPGQQAVDNYPPYAIPDMVTMSWLDESGQRHATQVAVKQRLPQAFTGEIVLTIGTNDSVLVTHRPYFEMPKNWTVRPQ